MLLDYVSHHWPVQAILISCITLVVVIRMFFKASERSEVRDMELRKRADNGQ